jgi:hypothetical protein
MKNVTLYAYLDISNPMVEWEVAIGRIKSNCDPLREPYGVSLWFYNNLKNKLNDNRVSELINEFRLEIVRNRYFPNAVSRMRGVFFFETLEAAKDILSCWRGNRFNPAFISSVNFSASNLTKVDSEWITQKLRILDNDLDWMRSYWAGDSYWNNPMTEIIASGIGLVTNIDLRKMAYERIIKREPLASKLLAFSAAKFFYGVETAGLTVPFIVKKGVKLVGNYYINMRAFENGAKPEMEEVLKYCQEKGAVFPYDSICDTSEFQTVGNFNGRFEIDNIEVVSVYNTAHGI